MIRTLDYMVSLFFPITKDCTEIKKYQYSVKFAAIEIERHDTITYDLQDFEFNLNYLLYSIVKWYNVKYFVDIFIGW